MHYILILAFIFGTGFHIFGQNEATTEAERTYNIVWEEPVTRFVSETETETYLYFTDALYDFSYGHLPLFHKRISLPMSGACVNVFLQNAVYEELTAKEAFIVQQYKHITDSIVPRVNTTQSRSDNYAHISFIPLRKNPQTGNLEKLKAFDLHKTYDFSNIGHKRKSKGYKNASVLASGDIYKLCVTRTGIYIITYNDLKDMGVAVDDLNPQHLRIYGNGGGMLPESNDAFRHDDLVENAIFVSGENNGVFNSGDYILFYAESPHAWSYNENESRFVQQKHLYSDVNCYFITADHGPGKRIADMAPYTGAPTHTVDYFHDYASHEKNETNLIKSGRIWFGELFDIQTEHSFSFNFPNIRTGSQVRLKTSLAARSFQNSYFTITAGSHSSSVLIQSVPTSYTSSYARLSVDTTSFNAVSSNITIDISYNKPGTISKGWLHYIQLNVERHLTFAGAQMGFRNTAIVGSGNVAEYVLNNAGSTVKVWDVTNPTDVRNVTFTLTGNQLRFTQPSDSLREYRAHNGTSYFSPNFVGRVPNQNLHGLGPYEMLIVTHPLFKAEAERLALLHYNEQDLSVVVVTTTQVYNEFSSGVRDATAIRDFAKMFYDRASTPAEKPRYLLLFGDGSYDNKERTPDNSNFIPTFQTVNSLDPAGSYVTDDYFGLFGPGEGQNAEGSLYIGIGRFPVRTIEQARNAVDKSAIYLSQRNLLAEGNTCTTFSGRFSNFGDWRNIICFVADDGDDNTHISQAEALANIVDTTNRNYNIDKIYLDAYYQETSAGGQRYPEVNDAINNRVQKGALVINYTGHGGELGWAHERVLEISDINSWTNKLNMPIFVTATCEFSRFDDPNRISAGEYVFLNPNGGSVALFSTSRLAFASSNFSLNRSFYQHFFNKVDGEYLALGDLMRLSKNAIGNISSVRNFVLLGDPALMPAHPNYNIVTTIAPDTMKALSKVTIEGYVADHNGLILDDFNGTIYPTVFDKPSYVTTLGNDADSHPFTFKLQKNILFKGKASVENGNFSFDFIVPLDIAYQYENGKISYYAEDGSRDASGHFEGFLVGGFNEDYTPDNEGPRVELYMNDESFVFGGITDENPMLLALLSDESGINTTGIGIGHDITAVLDDNFNRVIVLNDYYRADKDSYQSGRVEYPFYNLEEGLHNIRFKVWDVHNNSSDAYIEFYVTDSEALAIEHLLNYPNPFKDMTNFVFQHNQSCNALDVKIEIISMNGSVVKTIRTTFFSDGFKSDPIEWDGNNDHGSRINNGVYLYRLTVRTEEGHMAEKTEKLIVLK